MHGSVDREQVSRIIVCVGLLSFLYFRLCIDACGSPGLAIVVRGGFLYIFYNSRSFF